MQREEETSIYEKNTEILVGGRNLRKFKNYKIKTKSTSKKKPSKPARERKRGSGL
jgi:hypothetical protein